MEAFERECGKMPHEYVRDRIFEYIGDDLDESTRGLAEMPYEFETEDPMALAGKSLREVIALAMPSLLEDVPAPGAHESDAFAILLSEVHPKGDARNTLAHAVAQVPEDCHPNMKQNLRHVLLMGLVKMWEPEFAEYEANWNRKCTEATDGRAAALKEMLKCALDAQLEQTDELSDEYAYVARLARDGFL